MILIHPIIFSLCVFIFAFSLSLFYMPNNSHITTALVNKDTLQVNDNNFVGTIPDVFNTFGQLTFADFRDNRFQGTLPTTIFAVESLRILYLSENFLEGPIPTNFGVSTPLLRDLYLYSNQLTGTIPDIEPGELSELTEFLLQENAFEGSMPTNICELVNDDTAAGILEELWADCGSDADYPIVCACCTLCFPQ